MTRQKATNPDITAGLSCQQLAAVDLLAVGRSVTDTSKCVEVARQTVSEWLHHNPSFQAAINIRRSELWQEATDKLRALVPAALDVLKSEIENNSEGSLTAAIHCLKAVGLYGKPLEIGDIDPVDIELSAEEKAVIRENREMLTQLR